MERPISLRIPATLLSEGGHSILLRTSSTGQVLSQKFSHFDLAFSSLRHHALQSSHRKAHFPLFVHKSVSGLATFHRDSDSAISAWKAISDQPHRLQQFIQPFSKSVTLVRAHWKATKNVATFYFISHGPGTGKSHPSLATHMSNSMSLGSGEAFHACVSRSSANLIVQKSKSIPELDYTIGECVRLLSCSLKDNQRIVELVCDFVSDWTHQWVLLDCKGYRFRTKGKIKTETLAPKHEIDLNYLMFPLVARKAAIKKKINRTLLLGTIATKRRMSIVGAETTEGGYKPGRDIALLGASSLLDITTILADGASSFNTRETEPSTQGNLSTSAISDMHSSLLTRDVHKFESLVKGSQVYKEEIRRTVDMVAKHGGEDVWRPLLITGLNKLVATTGISVYFEEQLGVEECHMMVSGLLRVLRGNYNFYYKEALRRLHQRKGVTVEHFQVFITGLEGVVRDAQINAGDAAIVVKRFKSMEEYICPVAGEVKKQASLSHYVE